MKTNTSNEQTNKLWSRHTQAQSEIPFGTEDLSCVFFLFSPLDFVYLFRFWLHSVCIRSSEVIRAPFCLTVGLQIKTLKQTKKKKKHSKSLDKIAIPWAERGGRFSHQHNRTGRISGSSSSREAIDRTLRGTHTSNTQPLHTGKSILDFGQRS